MVSPWQRIAVLPLLSVVLIAARCHALATPQSGTASSRKRRPTTKGPSSHSADQSRAWYTNRSSKGIKKNRRRSPRWETEGDSLYHLIQGNGVEETVGNEFETARELLQATLQTFEESKIGQKTTFIPNNTNQPDKEGKKTPPCNTMWGACSVGPILRSRLSDLPAPTPVQEAAFSVLTDKRRENAILASATGTGKTLAYLLPLMSVMQRGQPQSLIIVTPTVDLAYQIQREVNRLWPTTATQEGLSALHVVEQRTEDEETELLSVAAAGAPILAGTPRALRKLLAEMKANKKMASLQFNLRTVVLDEADRLLRTEGVARDRNAPKTFGNRQKQKQQQIVAPTELLLSELGLPLDYNDKQNRIQLVCASATIGRTLRRQIMELTNAPSVDKAAVLITADSRTTKDATRRRASLLPPTIRHKYILRREVNGGDDSAAYIETLWDTMKQLPPAPALVFPGKVGVAPVAEALRSVYELKDVRTLQDRKDDRAVAASKSWKETTVYVMGEKFGRGLDIGVDYVLLSAPPNSPAAYVHLAGRTGRNGRPGTAITLVQGMKEAKRVAALAGALGVGFTEFDLATRVAVGVTVESEAIIVEQTMAEVDLTCQTSNPWADLSKSSLTRKTVAELTEYLMERVSQFCCLWTCFTYVFPLMCCALFFLTGYCRHLRIREKEVKE